MLHLCVRRLACAHAARWLRAARMSTDALPVPDTASAVADTSPIEAAEARVLEVRGR
jgi:hypothetical protein